MTPPLLPGRSRREPAATAASGSVERMWAARRFRRSARIEPVRSAEGEPEVTQHFTAPAPTLNRYGHLPFCCFPPPDLPRTSGVYVLTVDDEPAYVGKAQDLRKAWSDTGFARIFFANCFKKTKTTNQGQSTHCRVNHRILCAARDRRAIHLWIHETADRDSLKERLIAELRPPWTTGRSGS